MTILRARRNSVLFTGSITFGLLVPMTALAAEVGDGSPSSEVSEPAKAAAAHRGSVFVDPLGFLLFGPTAGIELGAGHVSGTIYGRWLNAGALAHRLFLKADESFAFSYGAGIRARYFLGEGMAGPHLGLGIELVHTRVDNSLALVATKSTYVVPLVEGGYRVPFSGAYVGAAAAFGYAFQASSSVVDLPGGRSAAIFVANDQSTVYGSAALELGIYF